VAAGGDAAGAGAAPAAAAAAPPAPPADDPELPQPSTSGRSEAGRGLTYDRQLATLQGLLQAQANTIASLQVGRGARGRVRPAAAARGWAGRSGRLLSCG
jgi:hypothetical protein